MQATTPDERAMLRRVAALTTDGRDVLMPGALCRVLNGALDDLDVAEREASELRSAVDGALTGIERVRVSMVRDAVLPEVGGD